MENWRSDKTIPWWWYFVIEPALVQPPSPIYIYIVLWFMSRFWDWTIPRIHRDLTVMQPSYLVWWSADILGWPGRCSYCQSFTSSQLPSHIESRNRGGVNILPQRSNTWPMIFRSCGLQIQFSMILFLVLMVDHCMRGPHCQSNHPQPEEGVVFSIIPFLRAINPVSKGPPVIRPRGYIPTYDGCNG